MEYKFEVWMDGCMLHEEDGFETEEEAEEEASDWVADKLDEWEADGCRNGAVVGDFDIRVKEC